jgi:hypothetical protein
MICPRKSHGVGLLHDSKTDLWHTRQVHEADPLLEVSGLGTGICRVDTHHKPVEGSGWVSK